MTDDNSPAVQRWLDARRSIREKSAQLVARIPHTDHNGHDADAADVIAFPTRQNADPEPPAAA